MRVLVTGGAGYIGSHTCKVLAQEDIEPIALDNLSEGHRWAVRWGALVEADLADGDGLRAALREYAVDAVIHFAAHAYVGESVEHPRKYFHNNVGNTLNLMDAMVDSGVKRIVFSSTCATYGEPQTVPIPEDHPQRPVNPYGESKLFAERALHWYGQAYGLRWVSLRYFNASGADADGEIGEDHDPETHLIPLVIAVALGHRPHVDIYGTDYPTPDGTAIRDYIHVTDLARAHVLALHHLARGGESIALNLGTGRGHSVSAVVEMVRRVGGRTVPVRECGRRPGDPPVLVADAARAEHLLAWQPQYADLRSIVETAWRWHSAPRRSER